MSLFGLLLNFQLESVEYKNKVLMCVQYLQDYNVPGKYRNCIIYLYKYLLLQKLNYENISPSNLYIHNIEMNLIDKKLEDEDSKLVINQLKIAKENPVHVFMFYYLSSKKKDDFFFKYLPVGELCLHDYFFINIL